MSGERKRQIIDINGKDVTVRFLERGVETEHAQLQTKLIPREELSALSVFLKERGLRVSFTTGVFDMIHIGHARYLQLAGSLGDILIVGLNTDGSVKRLKGPNRPILPEGKRAEMLSFLSFVDYVTMFPEDTGAEAIELLKPDAYLCVEGSWQGDIAIKEEVRAMAKHSGEVYYTSRQDPSLSTTAIIDKIGEQAGAQLLQDFQEFMAERNQG